MAFYGSPKFWLFAGGLLSGLILPPALKSRAAHKAAVNITAGGMQMRDDAKARAQAIKEEAQDVYAEAKQQRAAQAQKQQEAE